MLLPVLMGTDLCSFQIRCLEGRKSGFTLLNLVKLRFDLSHSPLKEGSEGAFCVSGIPAGTLGASLVLFQS